ncbi:MAG TPA: response regulator [Verrucomicrobiae bacterium]|nr:response regulator [Verrucomicrobiae bacterium]
MIPAGIKLSSFILAIDDEPEFLDVLKEALGSLEYRVRIAMDPGQAIIFYQEAWRDVSMVLLDFLMPRMNGDRVLAELQRINPNVRVVLLSGCPDVPVESMIQKGLRGYLRKPFTLPQLAKVVRDTVGEASAQRTIDRAPLPQSPAKPAHRPRPTV